MTIEYTSENCQIRRFKGGRVLSIFGEEGVTNLWVGDDGTMMDLSGDPVSTSDVLIARDIFSLAGLDHLVSRLRRGPYNEGFAARIRKLL